MPVQLPRRREVRGNRKYAQPITRRNIQAVQGQRDPGAQGGPNAGATPLAFGDGSGLVDAGNQLQQLGAQWQKEAAVEQARRDALLLERVILDTTRQLKQLQTSPPTRTGILNKSNVLGGINKNNPDVGGYKGPMVDGNIPEKNMTAGGIPWNQ